MIDISTAVDSAQMGVSHLAYPARQAVDTLAAGLPTGRSTGVGKLDNLLALLWKVLSGVVGLGFFYVGAKQSAVVREGGTPGQKAKEVIMWFVAGAAVAAFVWFIPKLVTTFVGIFGIAF